ncbi:MAG: aldehyde dehydrogenase family protein, partial [Acidimicrobiales bacterium]
RDADLRIAARRIAWAKFVNAGQTCVAPDYVLVDRRVEAQFVGQLVKTVERFYGADATRNTDLARIVNRAHFDRLVGLIENRRTARIVTGGRHDAELLRIAPTVITEVSWEEAVMQDEIFGPILPVLTVEDLDEAIATVGAHEKPLATYVFSESKAAVDRVIAETSSGAVVANAAMVHMAVADLPFGGVWGSGMGAYHGRFGFDTFSHRKAVLERASRPDIPLIYPPYTKVKSWLLRHVL